MSKIIMVQGGFPAVSASFILDQITGLIDRGFEVENWASYDPKEKNRHYSVDKYNLLEKTIYIKYPRHGISTEEWITEFRLLNNIDLRQYSQCSFHVQYGANFNNLIPFFKLSPDTFAIVSFHGYDASRYIKEKGPNCYDYLFERANVITTPSVYLANELINIGCRKSKIFVHRNGIELDKFKPISRQFSDKNLTFLTVSRLVEKKGLEYSIKAFSKFLNKYPYSKYNIIGDGPLQSNLMSLVSELNILDRVNFLGRGNKDDVLKNMYDADVYILTSVTAANGDKEGLPVTISEALATGLPVISSYHSGIPDLVIDGQTGFLAKEKDVDGIYEAMLEIASNGELRKNISAKCREVIKKEYNIESQNDKLKEIIVQKKYPITSNKKLLIELNKFIELKDLDKLKDIISQNEIEIDDSGFSFFTYARLLLLEGKSNECIEQLKNAITIEPTFTDSSKLLIEIYLQNGDFDEAKKLIEYIHQIIPNDEEINILRNSIQKNIIDVVIGLLRKKDWLYKLTKYKYDFHNIDKIQNKGDLSASVILITNSFSFDTISMLKKLQLQKKQVNFEIIFLFNGVQENAVINVQDYCDKVITLNNNTGAFKARNIATVFANSPILIFLDDDADIEGDFVFWHVSNHVRHNEIKAIRGKCTPKSEEPFKNKEHYNLGEKAIPYYLNLEGNLSIKANSFFKIGGFSDEIIYGYGGAELSYRLLKEYPSIEPSWYFPKPLIKHDYVSSENFIKQKTAKQSASLRILEEKYPDFNEMLVNYRSKKNEGKFLNNNIVRTGAETFFKDDILKINWVLTRKCNYTCSYCTVYDNKNGIFPSLDKLKIAVDQISTYNRKKIMVTLTGGEPTIHPQFSEFVKYIFDSLKETVSITTITNLSRTSRFFYDLSEKVKGYEKKLLFVASYHFDFAAKNKFLENAGILLKNNFRLHVSILAHPEHIELVKELESECKSLAKQYEKLNYELIIVRQDYGSEPDRRYKEADLKWLKQYYKKEEVNKNILYETVDSNNTIVKDYYSATEINAKQINNFKGMLCNAGVNMMSINEDGEIDKAVCFRKTNYNKNNIYENDYPVKDSPKPVICPFNSCSCIADIQIPKYLPGYENLDQPLKSDANILKENLDSIGWQNKYEFYKDEFNFVEYISKVKNPSISIIVISWRLHPDTIKNFEVLKKQRDTNFELIFVDNGGNENEFDVLKPFVNTYLRLKRNAGAYLARNIGSVFAQADKLLFLEDDGIPQDDFVEAHLDIFRNYNIVALRGVYLPKSDNPSNKVQKHYDLGEIPVPYYLNLEGNLSIKSTDFFEVGGFADKIQYGYGGADLAYRLKIKYPEGEPNWYFPQPKIYHDYTKNSSDLESKIQKQESSLAKLIEKYPGFEKFLEYYRLNHEILDIEKNNNENGHRLNLINLLKNYKIERDELQIKLSDLGWENKAKIYKDIFESVEYINKIESPKISIIVISWRLHRDNVKSFELLQKQRHNNFELIFVNNGADESEFEEVKKYVDTYVKLKDNTGAYLARNIGSLFAKSSLLFFLEDDGIPENNLVEAHINAHNNYDVIAVRGIYKFKSNSPFNENAAHYYLGERPFPIYADLEGNTSYRADLFHKVGGWDDEIKFGGGGVDLSIRLAEVEPDKRKQIYSPEPIIYHDYAKDEQHLKNKTDKQEKSRERLKKKHSHWDEFIKSYRVYEGKESPVIKKDVYRSIEMTRKPLVSICIPVYNQAHLIKDAINSALHQSYENTEILVVDDGSDDNIEEIIHEFRSSKIKFISKKHTNAPDTRNRAIKEAGGEFILWLDSDDILNENILDEYVLLLNKHKDIDLIYCSLQAMKTNGEIFYIYDYEDYYQNNDAMFRFLFSGQPIPNGGTLIKKEIYDQIGNYNADFKRAHDYEFFTRLVQTKKYNAKYVNKVLYTYRIHDNNITLNSSGKINFENERKVFGKLISENHPKTFFPEIDWTADHHMAATVSKLKIALRYYELHGFSEAEKYFVSFFEIDKDQKNLLDVINRYANDGNFREAQELLEKLKSLSNHFPDFNQIKNIIDQAVLDSESEQN